jgi:hypothetical protein
VIGLQALDEDIEIGLGVVHQQHATVREFLHAEPAQDTVLISLRVEL